MISQADKESFRTRCALAQYTITDPSRVARLAFATPEAITAEANNWYRKRMADGDFTKIVKIARLALENCGRLDSPEQIQTLVMAEIAYNHSLVVDVLLHDIAPLRDLLFLNTARVDEYAAALQLIIESFSEDES